MIVLGIDQSLTGSGVSIIDIDGIIEIDGIQGKQLIKSTKKGVKRLIDIKNQILVLNDKFKPDYVAMEGYGFMTKGRAFELGELGGMLKVMFTELGKEPMIIHPSHLKKYITGKGNADKSIMLMGIYKKYGIEFDNHNIADSFGISKMALDIMLARQGKKNRKDFNKEEWDVIRGYI